MKTLADLKKIRENAREEMKLRNSNFRIKVVVSMGTSGIALGARDIMKTFMEEISLRNLKDVQVIQAGEKGLSSIEPVIDVVEDGKEIVTYSNMTPDKAKRVVLEHIVNGKIVSDYVVKIGS